MLLFCLNTDIFDVYATQSYFYSEIVGNEVPHLSVPADLTCLVFSFVIFPPSCQVELFSEQHGPLVTPSGIHFHE